MSFRGKHNIFLSVVAVWEKSGMISTGECGRSDTITQIKKRAIEILERLPEEKMIYVFNILQNIEALCLKGEVQNDDTSDDTFTALKDMSRGFLVEGKN